MDKNKNIYWVLLMAVAMTFGLSACSKFLDRKPLTATMTDLGSVLESQSYTMYSTLRTYAGFSSLPWLDFNSIRDDDTQKGSSTTDGAEINTEFETFQYTKDDWATDTYWNDHYYMISLANQLIYTADSLKLTDPASLQNIGEASFFRAYAYFELVKAYGDIPLINFYSTNASAYLIPKSPAASIYAQIDADLAVAAKDLPVNWVVGGNNTYPGRLTSGAANTLWAKTYLFRNNWGKVISLCNQVIASNQYSLNPTFAGIWQDGMGGAGKNGPESIFEMQATVGAGGGFGGANYNGCNWGTSQQVRQGGASITWNLGWGWNVPTQVLQNAWDSTDPRKAETILYSGQSDGGSSTGGWGGTLPIYSPGAALDQPYWSKKMYAGNDPQMRTFTAEVGGAEWINHRILRYADVLLMLAEASNETGDGATAAVMLEKIRARARGGNSSVLPYVAFLSQSQMRTAIKNERRWEFALEGYRFDDLVRWGDATTVLSGLGYQPKNALYPIPQPAITLNPKLVQNPNYP